MKLAKTYAVLCSIAVLQGPAGAAVTQGDIDQAVSQISTDSRLLSQWLADQFKDAAAFNATTGAVVPKQLKLFGFEIGVEGMVSATDVDVDALRALPTSIVNPNDIDMEDTLPIPGVIAHAKIGLPFGLDAGVRLGGIPEQEFDNSDTHVEIENKIFGIDLRKKIIEEGITRPFGLTMGLSYTHSKADISWRSPYSSNLGTTVVGTNNYSSTLSATGTDVMEWETDSLGLQAIVNKQIAFFNPYVGASVNHNSGSVNNTLTSAGTVTLTNTANSADTRSETFTTSGAASADVKEWNVRALLGAEFSLLPFLRLGVHGEYAGSDALAGALGLRFQFR
jgi:hypothetical protein